MEPKSEAPIGFVEPASPDGLAVVATSTIPNETVEEMVAEAFPDAPIMVRVAQAESHFDPTAKNPHSSATGVFQILSGTWRLTGCAGSPTNPEDNIECARKLYDVATTTPWLASKKVWQ